MNTVAAGGGSMLFFRSGMFVVGPESAGAHPGPVCYRKGGHLTVTDANLCLGRLLPEYFPKIFGPKENEPLDRGATIKAFEAMTSEVSKHFLLFSIRVTPPCHLTNVFLFCRLMNFCQIVKKKLLKKVCP